MQRTKTEATKPYYTEKIAAAKVELHDFLLKLAEKGKLGSNDVEPAYNALLNAARAWETRMAKSEHHGTKKFWGDARLILRGIEDRKYLAPVTKRTIETTLDLRMAVKGELSSDTAMDIYAKWAKLCEGTLVPEKKRFGEVIASKLNVVYMHGRKETGAACW